MKSIFYLDEDPDQRESFATKAAITGFFGEIIRPAPNPVFEEMVNIILRSDCSALVTDFNLKEHDDTITYDGAALASAITERRENFPCFIVTSFENDALKENVDVNMIYDRINFNNDNFFKRVQAQIRHHEETLDNLSGRLAELTQKPRADLDEQEVIELFAIDRKIEGVIDSRGALPKQLRNNELEDALQTLIEETEELIVKMKLENK